MKADDVRRLYDAPYAAAYEASFLESELTAADARYELELIRSLVTPGGRWLDVACGTGYFLSHFPDVDRTGLDLSPAMAERARARNPGVEIVLHDFREPLPAWTDRFDLVSCMWYAYCYAETVAEVMQLIGNLAAWTSPRGRCFVPLADPRLIARCPLPYYVEDGYPGQTSIVGILWSYVEDGGKKAHTNLLAPNVQFMQEQFGVFFERVEIVDYPPARPGQAPRPALIASAKRQA